MRTVALTVHNNQKLEIFTQALKDGFELWTAGMVAGRRIILTHYLTHDDLEARLEYASPHDLVWKEAAPSALPEAKHAAAFEWEASIKRGAFVDSNIKQQHSVSSHLDVINLLPLDRKVWNFAKKAILGRWTDGVATVVFEPDSKLQWSCPLDCQHPLNIGALIHKVEPNWWNFASWQLPLMNHEHKKGIRLGVLRVDDGELHVLSIHQDRLAYILRRSA